MVTILRAEWAPGQKNDRTIAGEQLSQEKYSQNIFTLLMLRYTRAGRSCFDLMHPMHNWSNTMRITTTLAAAAALAVSGVAASAGGMAEEIMEAPVVVAEPAPAASSVSPTYVVVGVLAALLIAAAAAE